MKTKQLIFAMFCMVAMVSCSSEEPLTEAKQPAKQVTLTLTYGDGADTRTSFEVSDTGLTRVWAAGDKVHLSEFENTTNSFGILELSSGANTKTATFSGTLKNWNDGETKEIYVKYGPLNSDGTEMDWSGQEGTLTSLGKYDFYFYKATATLKGDKLEISNCQLISQSLFICLPKDLQLLTTGTGKANLGMLSDQFASGHDLSHNGWSAGYLIYTSVELSEGKLTSDVYLAAGAAGWPGEDINFTMSFNEHSYQMTLKKSFSEDENYGNGKLYTVTQSIIDNAGGFQ